MLSLNEIVEEKISDREVFEDIDWDIFNTVCPNGGICWSLIEEIADELKETGYFDNGGCEYYEYIEEDNCTGYVPCTCIDCIENNKYIYYCDHMETNCISDHEPITTEEGNTYSYNLEGEVFQRCASCGEYHDMEDIFYHEDNWEYYCRDCYPQGHELIFNYHEWDGEFKKLGLEKEGLYFGIEIEMTSNNLNSSIEYFTSYCYSNNIDWQDIGHFESDCSINGEGVEFITNPMSYNFAKDILPKLYNAFEYAEFMIDSSCGQHIHYSRTVASEETLLNTITFLENNKEDVIKFSKRESEMKFKRWSKFYNNEEEQIKRQVAMSKDYNRSRLDRYHTINLTNDETIECRIFAGTLDSNITIANIEFLKAIIEGEFNKYDNFYSLWYYARSNNFDYLRQAIQDRTGIYKNS